MLVGQRNCQIWKWIYPNAGYKRKFAFPIRKVSLKATSYLEMFTLESDKYFKHTRCISVVGNWRQDIQANVYEKTNWSKYLSTRFTFLINIYSFCIDIHTKWYLVKLELGCNVYGGIVITLTQHNIIQTIKHIKGWQNDIGSILMACFYAI